VSWFFVAPLRMLTSGDRTPVKVLDGWHQNFLWALLVVAGLHVAAALVHLFYFRDGVTQRMLPSAPATGAFVGKPVRSSSDRS
jgi:cytochrome b561